MNADNWASLIPLVLLLVFAYLVLIRPARRRAQEIQSVQTALSPGDEVMLTSGMFGVVNGVEDDRLRLEIAPGIEVAVARAAVAKILRDVPADDGFDADAADDFGVDDDAAADDTAADDTAADDTAADDTAADDTAADDTAADDTAADDTAADDSDPNTHDGDTSRGAH